MPTRIKVWIEAARPKTLPAAIVPVMVGTAFAAAHAQANPFLAMVCLVFALLVQIGTNFANDYFDFRHGADTPERVGPRRAVATGLVAPRTMLFAAISVLAIAFVVGLQLAFSAGWQLLPLGIVCLVCAVAYTGGPYPLGYNGLGDLFVFVFFGLVAVSVTFFVQTGAIVAGVWAAAAAIGLLAANILVVNNYRDVATDARAGKRTLVVRFGRKFAVWQYGLSHVVALAVPLVLFRWNYGTAVLAPLVLMPLAVIMTFRLARSANPSEQIALLGGTARYLAIYGLLLSGGVLWRL